jgi:hypothetical protein
MWRIVELSGSAQVVQPGVMPVALTSGDTLEPGQKVSTGSDGRVILERGDSVITISPNSRMGLPKRNDGGLATRILHSIGTLLFKVEKRAQQHFEVQTPFMAAVVKGTSFTTSVDARGGAVHVVSGLVEVSDPRSGQATMVRPGQTAIRAANSTGLRVVGQNVPAGGGDVTGNDRAAADTDNESQGGADGTTRAAEAQGAGANGNGPGNGPDLPANANGNGTTIAVGIGLAQIDPGKVTAGLVRGRSATAPGHTGATPGRSNGAQGGSANAPGRSASAPGRSASAPGRSGSAPGRSGGAPGGSAGAPWHSTGAPGRSASAPGRSAGTPAAAASTPGRSASAPGRNRAPAAQSNNPGRGKAKGKSKGR